MYVIIIRTFLLYVFVTFAIRIMGKRQIADMQPNELVITLLISEIAAIPLQDTTQPVINGIVAIFVLIIIEITLSATTMKSIFLRKFLSGKSVIIINDGVIDQTAMKKVRLTIVDLIELLRQQNVFDISTVAYAILEVNGNLSILLKGEYRTASVKDVCAPIESDCCPLLTISDGKIIKESLNSLNISERRVRQMVEQKKYKG